MLVGGPAKVSLSPGKASATPEDNAGKLNQLSSTFIELR